MKVLQQMEAGFTESKYWVSTTGKFTKNLNIMHSSNFLFLLMVAIFKKKW